MKGVFDVIRETVDESVMQETGRSVGDLASGRVARTVIEALQREGYEIVHPLDEYRGQ